MRWLSELEHHVVRGVHHIVDRPHAGKLQPPLDPLWRLSDDDVGQDGHAESRAEFVIEHLSRCERGSSGTRPGDLRRSGRPILKTHATGEVSGDPRDAPGVRSIPLDGHVEDHVGLDAQGLGDRSTRSGRGNLGQ